MKHQAIIITGVAGSGKSSVGALLAQQLGSSFYDGDEFHPEANIEKTARNDGGHLSHHLNFPLDRGFKSQQVAAVNEDRIIVQSQDFDRLPAICQI